MSAIEEENKILRKILWLNHGHTGMYGDDGEMQCAQCKKEYGFWDWKRTSATEIQTKMRRVKNNQNDYSTWLSMQWRIT